MKKLLFIFAFLFFIRNFALAVPFELTDVIKDAREACITQNTEKETINPTVDECKSVQKTNEEAKKEDKTENK